MSQALTRHIEPLEDDELKFLERLEFKDRKMYFKVFDILMLMSFIIPFIGSWYRAYDGAPDAFSVKNFFFTAGVLLSISTTAVYLSYRLFLRKIQADIRYKTKTIEICRILKKLYVPNTHSYYFYIDSPDKLSIEVSEIYYNELGTGDEVSVEFTTHAKMYLGYF